MNFSPDQERALNAIMAWLAGDLKRLTLGGHAGTGKTTLIREFIDRIGGQCSVCAFAGKAAHVLRQKGVPASTIHKLIYEPYSHCVMCDLPEDSCCCGSPLYATRFVLVDDLPSNLVIVDEASMVNRRLVRDLESFEDARVLYVGDHGQLEPIGDDPRLMVAPDIRLEQIHRQANGSPIIAFAHHVREGNQPVDFGPKAALLYGRPWGAELLEFDAILCGYNDTRVKYNARVRELRGYHGKLPCRGERVICLRNNTKMGIFNGMIGTVRNIGGGRIDVVDDCGDVYTGMPFEPDQFGSPSTLSDTRRTVSLWDFGYCCTVHKFQGSEERRVLVLEEISRTWSASRWRYTAATRASEELVYCLSARR